MLQSDWNLPTTERHLFQMACDCYEAQLAFCEELETLADELPISLNSRKSMQLLDKLSATLAFFHEFEEISLFPLIKKMNPRNRQLQVSILRLSQEHIADRDFVSELSDKLVSLAVNTDMGDMKTSSAEKNEIETLAYMLRGFFEGLRRHVAFEQELIARVLEIKEPNVEKSSTLLKNGFPEVEHIQ